MFVFHCGQARLSAARAGSQCAGPRVRECRSELGASPTLGQGKNKYWQGDRKIGQPKREGNRGKIQQNPGHSQESLQNIADSYFNVETDNQESLQKEQPREPRDPGKTRELARFRGVLFQHWNKQQVKTTTRGEPDPSWPRHPGPSADR